MLTIATLGMFAYGAYSIAWAVIDLVQGARLEIWAEIGLIAFGLLLALGSALVRVRLPGGLAFAIGAMLGLQALAVYSAGQMESGLTPQIMQALFAVLLVALSFAGDKKPKENVRK